MSLNKAYCGEAGIGQENANRGSKEAFGEDRERNSAATQKSEGGTPSFTRSGEIEKKRRKLIRRSGNNRSISLKNNPRYAQPSYIM